MANELRERFRQERQREREQERERKRQTHYGVFVWNEQAHYPPEKAVKVYKSEKVADKAVRGHEDKGWVVRQIRLTNPPRLDRSKSGRQIRPRTMRYLVNRPDEGQPKRMAKVRRKSRRRRTAAQRRATAKMIAANRAKRAARRRPRRRTNAHLTRGVNMARRKSRRRKATAAPRRRRRRNIVANAKRRVRRRSYSVPRRRRRRYRNPAGIVNTLINGVLGAGAVVGGEMAANIIANQIPMFLKETQPNAAGGAPVEVETKAGTLARKALAGLAVGFVASMIFRNRPQLVRDMVNGAFASPVKQIIRPVLPTTGPFAGALSAGGRMVRFSAYPNVGAYPRLVSGLSAYPEANDRTALAGYGNNNNGFDYSHS